MASRIQGITVEIGGDTTKLSKALEGLNKSIKGTQSGLKDVNKLLKLDPTNTELVVQKQKMLKDAIEATKEKLTTLKTAAQQANEQLANGKITQQQYDALQREIAETEQNLKSLQDQAATTNATLAKIDEAGEKLQNLGSSVENVGKKFLPVTAAVTGLGTAAVKTAADFDAEMSKVSAISGATGDDFDQLRAKAREMGAKTKFSASEAASAMEYMAMAGWKTSDMLGGIEGIMNLAAASGEDLATTSDIVTDALTAFGLSASDSGHFADILAAASSNANTNVSMMGETFKYCAPIAGALGFSAEDTAEAIGLMANSGNSDSDRIADDLLYGMDSHPDRNLHRADCNSDSSNNCVERHCVVSVSAADWHPDPDEYGMECDQDGYQHRSFCNPVHSFFHLVGNQQSDLRCGKWHQDSDFFWLECHEVHGIDPQQRH